MSRIQQLFVVAVVLMKSWTMVNALSDSSGLQKFTSPEGLNRKLRGIKTAPIRVKSRRLMAPMMKSSSSYPSYIGCLNMTASELQENWIFPGTAPSCSYVHHNGSSSGGSGSSSGSSGSSGGSSSNGGSGSNSGSSGGNGGSSSGDGSGSSSGNDSSSSSNNGDGSSSSGTSGSGNNNSGGDSSSSGSDGSGESSPNNNGSDSSSSGNNGSGNTSSNNNGGDSSSSGYDGSGDSSSNNTGDDGRNSGGSTVTYGEYVSEYGSGGQGYGNNNGEDGYGGDGSYSPYSDFDVGTCDTYENLWLWDFSLTCDDADNLENCECNFAEEMMGIGLLSCDMAAQCPKDCAICTTCFQVIGCVTGGQGGLNSAKSAANFLYVIAAGVGVLFFGIIYYSANRKRGNQDLSASLMEDGASGSGAAASSPLAPPVWLAPDDASTADVATPQFPSSPVWLAPDAPPAQFFPSSEAAIESSGESTHETGETAHGAFIIPGIFPVSSDESSESEDNNVWLAPVS